MGNTQTLIFDKPSFSKRLCGMLGVDFYRLFHTPMFYIFLAIAAIIPAMVLSMTGMGGQGGGGQPLLPVASDFHPAFSSHFLTPFPNLFASCWVSIFFSSPPPQIYIFPSAFFYILSLALTAQ